MARISSPMNRRKSYNNITIEYTLHILKLSETDYIQDVPMPNKLVKFEQLEKGTTHIY